MPAPEGSEERTAARTFLVLSARLGIDGGMSADEWVEKMRSLLPEVVESAGERDLEAIVAFTLATRRR